MLTPTQPSDHPEIPAERVGVLLINLGTPDATDFWSIRRYLREFLSDRRVIEVNPLRWQVILNLFILNLRPQIAGKAYREIWDTETNESPLRRYTREQSEGLGAQLMAAGRGLDVDWAMRYGNPSIAEKLEAMRARGCRKILLLALYPQYSAATTATAYDKAFVALGKMRWQPAIRTAPAYPDEPTYIEALVKSVRAHLGGLDWEPDVLLASFQSIIYITTRPWLAYCYYSTCLAHQASAAAGQYRYIYTASLSPKSFYRKHARENTQKVYRIFQACMILSQAWRVLTTEHFARATRHSRRSGPARPPSGRNSTYRARSDL